MIPEDSRVEIDAKINAGYFTTGAQITDEQLKQVAGRGWEKWEDIAVSVPSVRPRIALIFDPALSLSLSCGRDQLAMMEFWSTKT